MAKTGDIVRFLNTTGGGRIARIDGQIAHVVDDDGFEVPMLLKECVVVAEAGTPQAERSAWTAAGTPSGSRKSSAPAPKAASAARQPEPEPEKVVAVAVDEIPVEETAEGERLNVVLGFEPRDIHKLSTTTVDMSLVNDSNYYLQFALMTRRSDDDKWTLRYAGTVEPNIQLLMAELNNDDLAAIERIAFQYVAYKQQRDFSLKAPGSYEASFDNTRFFRLHCYKPNTYFDGDVIAVDLVRDDKVAGARLEVDSEALAREMMRKKEADRRRPVRRNPNAKRQTGRRVGEIIEVDLHISELVDTTAGLSNADMLNLQIDTFQRVMNENRNNKGQRIVFIHGKGEGVLRQAILKELNNRYKGNDVQDASFREYGFGATQVTIR